MRLETWIYCAADQHSTNCAVRAMLFLNIVILLKFVDFVLG